MQNPFNYNIFLLYLGGIFSLFLTVAIVFVKQIQKRNIERKRLEQVKNYRPEEVGDIEAKLDDSFEFRFPKFMQEITIWGIQPLFIISFVNLFTGAGVIESSIAFALVILTLFHEFYFADRYSSNVWYQTFLVFLWVITFCIMSSRTNYVESQKKISAKQAEMIQNTSLLIHQDYILHFNNNIYMAASTADTAAHSVTFTEKLNL